MVEIILESIAGNSTIMYIITLFCVLLLIALAGKIVTLFIKPLFKVALVFVIIAVVYAYKPVTCQNIWKQVSCLFFRVTKSVQENLDDFIVRNQS